MSELIAMEGVEWIHDRRKSPYCGPEKYDFCKYPIFQDVISSFFCTLSLFIHACPIFSFDIFCKNFCFVKSHTKPPISYTIIPLL